MKFFHCSEVGTGRSLGLLRAIHDHTGMVGSGSEVEVVVSETVTGRSLGLLRAIHDHTGMVGSRSEVESAASKAATAGTRRSLSAASSIAIGGSELANVFVEKVVAFETATAGTRRSP